MSFMGRNNNDDNTSQSAPPPTPNQAEPVPPPMPNNNQSDSGGGIVQYLKDTYNGLYKVVIEPSMPTRQTIILLVVGVIIGLIWGYAVFPVEFTGANPNRLNETAQEYWLRITAMAGSSEASYSDETVLQFVQQIPNPQAEIDALIQSESILPEERRALQDLQEAIEGAELNPAPEVTPPGFVNSAVQVLLPLILIIVITPILVVVWRLLFYPNVVAPAVDQVRQMTDSEYKARRQRDKEAQQTAKAQADFRRKMREEQKADAELGEPISTNLAIFDAGRNFDESFEIELPQEKGGDFLGQCGAAIAESTDPNAYAIELWLFDMFSANNFKKVFVTEQAWNNPSIRSQLEADVDNPDEQIAVASEGAKLTIDSDKLRLQGTLQELEVDSDGKFQSFKMPVVAWQKDEAGGAAPPAPKSTGTTPTMDEYEDIEFEPPPQMPGSATSGSGGQRSMDEYEDIEFEPPPQMPGSSSSEKSSGQRQPLEPPPLGGQSGSGGSKEGGGQRLEPPPLNMPSSSQSQDDGEDEDDPFGGTGDFTPLPKR